MAKYSEHRNKITFVPRKTEEIAKKWGFLGFVDSPVFIISVAIILVFTIWGMVDTTGLGKAASAVLTWMTTYMDCLYLGAVAFFLVFCIIIACSKYGKVKLGKPEDKPDYSTFSWFAMLFGCGMGVGLIFWSVAEPINHLYAGPAYAGVPGSEQAAEWSLAIMDFHWGLSAWDTFAVVGIVMGIIIYKKGLPALMSSCFYPILGDKIYGPIGKAIDIITLIATFFGMCTTIGLGTMQLASGVNFNYGVPVDGTLYAIILVIVVGVYLCSACLPIDKGIKVGSNISMVVCILLMLYLVVAGPTKFIFDETLNALGIYIQNLPSMSLWTDPINQSGWLGSWTVFYWAWWIAWAPFVGMFMAKISKGRTIREFVLAALIAPTIFDIIFIGIFGSSALAMELDSTTTGILWSAIQSDVASAIYVLFSQYPGIVIVAPLLLFVCFTFFVVSADSCTIVLGMLSSGGSDTPKTSLKILWGVAMGVAAGVLLAMGGLNALQTSSIVGAFPFTFIMLALCYTTVKMLKTDYLDETKPGFYDDYEKLAKEQEKLGAGAEDEEKAEGQAPLHEASGIPDANGGVAERS